MFIIIVRLEDTFQTSIQTKRSKEGKSGTSASTVQNVKAFWSVLTMLDSSFINSLESLQ